MAWLARPTRLHLLPGPIFSGWWAATTSTRSTCTAGVACLTGVTSLALITANDVPTRDSITFELQGSNAGIDGPYRLIVGGDIVDFIGEIEWPRFTKNETEMAFDNDVAYTRYQALFPTVRDSDSANSMQIAEVELLGVVQ